MSLIDFLLNRSNSYNYYKFNSQSSKKEIKKLQDKLKVKNDLINIYQDHLNNKSLQLLEYKSKKFNRINIAYVLHQFPVLSQTFVVNEIRWLVENGYNVYVFSNKPTDKTVKLNFSVKHFKFKNKLDLARLLIDFKIDFMYSHFVYPVCTNFTYPVGDKLKIPFAVFAHAYDIFVYDNIKRNKISEISKSPYCIAIFTLSKFHENFLINCGVRKNKIVITKQASSYTLSSIRQKPKIKNIVSVSRFVEKKGIDILIDAAKLLEDEDFEFKIYGYGILEDEYKKHIRSLNLKNIKLLGELKPEEVEDILSESDLLVVPSKLASNGDMDGFPTIIFEAMACGTMVIATDVSAIPEILKDNINGFVINSNNSKKLAFKIKEVSNMPVDKLTGIRKEAQKSVVNISSTDKTMNTFIKTIKRRLYDVF